MFVFAALLAAPFLGAAPLTSLHLSARPIDNVSITASDREFLSDVAAEIHSQSAVADIAIQFTHEKDFIETARHTMESLAEIEADLGELAKLKDVALPLAGNVELPRAAQRVMNSRNGALDRNYEAYAERSSRRLLEKFYHASKKADDPEVRAFALRHVRLVYGQYRAAKLLDAPPAAVLAESRVKRVGSGRAAEIFVPPTSVPLAAAGSPASPGASR